MSKSHDIVERLRIRQPLLGTLCDEAADEIERLHGLLRAANQITKEREAEIERLRQELELRDELQQGYRDEIVLYLPEIERLKTEIKQLREQLASLQASSGYEASIAQLEIERLRQEVLTLRGMHQGYRDEIVEHFREIERLNIKIKRKGYDKVT